MDITKLSTVELEALAYKQICLLNQTQKNVQVIETELAKRYEVKDAPKTAETPDTKV